MTSYETNATQAQWAKGQSSSSGSDFKKLKSKYASQLSTLKELFANWSDEDLLFAIQDADGDLELTIERISEGDHHFRSDITLFARLTKTKDMLFSGVK